MKTIQLELYQINEHPNKEAVFDWVRDNWHDLGEWEMDDFIESLKALAKHLNATVNYSTCLFPERGEYIDFSGFDPDELNQLNADAFPLTGCVWDSIVIKGLKNNDMQSLLDTLHESGKYIYSDEGIAEYLECNEYYFTVDGAFYE